MMPMPAKKASRVSTFPYLSDPVAAISAWASGKSSASDMNIITPALSPNAPARKLLLTLFLKSTSAPPRPVADPAMSVRSNAVVIPFISVVMPFVHENR